MSPELEAKLVAKYPLILISCREVAVSDGWYNLLDLLLGMIQSHIDCQKKYNNITVPQVHAVQIKEKFGGLRFYCNGGDERTSAYVSFAGALSETVCERCGHPGSLRAVHNWMRVRCEACETVNDQK